MDLLVRKEYTHLHTNSISKKDKTLITFSFNKDVFQNHLKVIYEGLYSVRSKLHLLRGNE